MAIKTVVALLVGLILGSARFAEAQQPGKVPKIGYLGSGSFSSDLPYEEAFRQGLRDLGYVEGQNIIIEYRHAEGKLDRLPDFAVELVRLRVAPLSHRIHRRLWPHSKQPKRSPLFLQPLPIHLA